MASDIAKRIAILMENQDISYGELSMRTNIAKSALQRYATGETEKIPIDRLEKIATALGTSAAAILGWDVAPASPQGGERDAKRAQFGALFDQLTQEQQELVIAAMRGMLPKE